jgi:hypothetical protein
MNLILPAAVLGAAFLLLRKKPPAFIVPPAGAVPPSSGETSSGGTSSGGTSSGGDRALVRRLQTALNLYHIGLCAPSQTNPTTTIALCRPGLALEIDGIVGPLTLDSLNRFTRDQGGEQVTADSWRRYSSRERADATAFVEYTARRVAAMNYTERREYLADVRG